MKYRYSFEKDDPILWNAVYKEEKRQNNCIDLIPSENYAPLSVRVANGSCFMNKYAEGRPKHRYYSGCENADTVELLAQSRLKKAFGVPQSDYANVQLYSGTEANLEVYEALLKPGDSILSMSLNAGGHLSHGAPASLTYERYTVHQYGVDKNGYIDYHNVAQLARKYKPKLIICGASAYPRLINWRKFKEIANSVHAYLMADVAHLAGLCVGQAIPSPSKHADVITGTAQKSLRCDRQGFILAKAKFGKALSHSVFPRFQGGPHINLCCALAAGLFIDLQPSFKQYARQIVKNAKAMASVFNKDDIISLLTGGTDNHLMILDLRHTNMDGDTLQNKLEKVHITTNKEMIPNDPLPPTKTSGLRVGTPAITTRGFKENDCKEVARMILAIVHHPNDKNVAKQVSQQAHKLTSTHPIND